MGEFSSNSWVLGIDFVWGLYHQMGRADYSGSRTNSRHVFP